MTTSSEDDPLAGVNFAELRPTREVEAAIHRECTNDLKPKRSLSSAQRLLLSLVLTGVVVGLLYALSLDHEHPPGTLQAALFGAAGWAIVQALVLAVGVARPPGKRASRLVRLLIAVFVPVMFLAYLAVAASQRLPIHDFLSEGGNAGNAIRCGLHALLYGAIASGGVLFVWRRTDPLTPGLSGALVGLVGGLAGAAAIGIACPAGETWHMWVGHGLTVVVLAGLGCLVGRKWLTP